MRREPQARRKRRGIDRAHVLGVLDQRMPDVGARGAAEALVRGRLERQQRQHMIDIGPHA